MTPVRPINRRRSHGALLAAALVLGACAPAARPTAPTPTPPPARRPAAPSLVPMPASVRFAPADTFTLDTTAIIAVMSADGEAVRIGRYLAGIVGTTATTTPRVLSRPDAVPPGSIELALEPGRADLGDEGYELTVDRQRARIAARAPAGLFYGVQTFRQLMPASVEYTAALPRAFRVPGAHIVDRPRFPWRGAMLDVARHFRPPADVKRFIDLLALYKLNRLHLHLADDQGWRIEIPSWPNLTKIGGSTQVGGLGGGFYTRADYADLVQYARDRFITLVPEIDMPGHINAAMASYPELNCDGVAPPLYTGTRVGFSALCLARDSITYRFIDDVVREIGGITPGDYFHIGGDEVEKLTHEQYRGFVERVAGIVQAHGKRMIGWGEIAPANLPGSVIVQHWRPDSSAIAAARGSKIILSPGKKMYLDMQYDGDTPIGLHWAGFIDLKLAYDWDPGSYIAGVPESAILGLEAPLWSETIGTISDVEYLAFPRLVAIAERAWSPANRTGWDDFRARLRGQVPRWKALGVNYYDAPQLR
ncbi:MAG TPA: family 20 glycosylhydrolase [Longimicrobiales bacterium]|nr:family 20 glycosylhydrolase [Longimicrobiales bacterium]